MKIKETSLFELSDDILVRCPKCNSCSFLTKLEIVMGYRLCCHNCAYTNKWSLDTDFSFPIPGKGPVLDGFGLQLWLQTNCCGNVLWAYNSRHVEYLSELVEAKLRERNPDPKWGWCNSGVYSKLPKWILSSKNREDIIKGLKRIQKLLPEKS